MERYPSSASPARRRSSTRGSSDATPSSTRASASAVARGQWSRSAGRGSSPTATSRRASRSCASSSTASASSRREFGAPLPRVLEPGRLRLQRPAAAAHARRGHHALPDPEAVLERVQPGRRTTRSAGQGIDGSEVLAHFPPADTYNADGHRGRAALQRAQLQGPRPLRAQPPALRLRRRRRRADARDARAPAPRERPPGPAAHGPADAARRSSSALEAETDDWPTVVGELYFEYHRGTYTTQAATKRAHRKAEVAAARRRGAGGDRRRALGRRRYPRDALRALWQPLLLDAVPRHPARVLDRRGLRGRAADLEAVAPRARRCGRRRSRRSAAAAARPSGQHAAAAPRREVVATPEGALRVVAAPPLGGGGEAPPGDAVAVQRDGDGVVLVNGALRATLAPGGDLRRPRPPADRPRGAGRARRRLRALRRPPGGLGRVGPRPARTSRRAPAAPPATSCAVTAAGRCGPRSSSSAR